MFEHFGKGELIGETCFFGGAFHAVFLLQDGESEFHSQFSLIFLEGDMELGAETMRQKRLGTAGGAGDFIQGDIFVAVIFQIAVHGVRPGEFPAADEFVGEEIFAEMFQEPADIQKLFGGDFVQFFIQDFLVLRFMGSASCKK